MITSAFFLLAIVLFCGGLYLVLTRLNALAAILGIELMLNAANLNFAGMARLHPATADEGYMAVLFVIVVAAAEAAVGLAIILTVFQRRGSTALSDLDQLQG
jgi:NADH-quinone oxidoreductase subunit K